MINGRKFHPMYFGPFGFFVSSPLNSSLTAVGVWSLFFIYCILVGMPEMRSANGSPRRLIWVSALLGLFGTLPTIVVAVFAALGLVSPDQLSVAAIATIFNVIFIPFLLLPPAVLVGTKAKFPLVTNERFLTQVAAISKSMQIPVPLVRRWPSIDGSQQIQGFAGTLQAPQLVVSDGLINRLDSDECDAIVAHELAHIANGSLFLLAIVFPLSGAITTLATVVGELCVGPGRSSFVRKSAHVKE